MAIMWNNSMSVANNGIDSDHQKLIQIVNNIEEALGAKGENEFILKELDELEKYTVEHFAREEAIMKKINYPHRYHHFIVHHELTSQLLGLKTNIKTEGAQSEKEVPEEDIIQMMRHWLLDHVLHDDLQMKPFLSQFPKDYV